MNPKAIGEISEAKVVARLVELGYAVSIPFGNNQRYDLIVDDGTLTRVQVKTARYKSGCIVMPTASKNGFTGVRSDYTGSIDEFIGYCPENDTCYRVPIESAPSTYIQLRIDPPLPGASLARVRYAKDFQL